MHAGLSWTYMIAAVGAVCAGGPRVFVERVSSRGGNTTEVASDGQNVFLLEQGALGAIEPADLAIRDEVTLPTVAGHAIAVQGGYAFVGSFRDRIVVVDVGNPDEMRVVAALDHPGEANELVSDGQFLYIADGAFPALRIFDITDPAAPTLVGELSTEFLGASSVRVVGHLAYLADSANSTLATVDVSDPSAPVLLAWLDSARGDSFDDLDVRRPYAYLTGEYLVQVVDVADPRSPLVLGEVGDPFHAGGILVVGGLALVATGPDGVSVVDVSDPQAPDVIQAIPTSHSAEDLVALNERFYVADTDGLEVLSFDGSGTLERVAHLQRIGFATNLSARGAHLFVSSQFTRDAHVVSIADPQGPALLGSVALEDPGELLAVGDFLYVADGFWGLRTISIADPADPRLGDTLPLGSGVLAAALEQIEAYLYVGSSAGARKIITVSRADPARPEVVGETVTSDNVRDLAIANDYLLAATENALQIFDIGDRTNPTLAQHIPSSDFVLTVEVRWPYLFLNVRNFGLRVLDVSDIKNPVVVGEYPAGNYPSVVRLGGPFAFLGALGRMEVLSISDPTAPRWLATIEQVNNPSDARFVDGRLVLTDGRVDVYRLDTGGDLDADGDVDVADFATFSACFGGSGVPCEGDCCLADFTGDGSVDITDFATFAANYTGSQ